MKTFIMKAAVAMLRGAAAFIGVFAWRRKGVALISCQGDEPSQDILDLAAALRGMPQAPRVRVLAGKMDRSAGGAFRFAGKMLSMLRAAAGARVVVVDAYCPAVSIPEKRPGQKVVQIWHAPEAIKKFSLQIVDTEAGYSSHVAELLCMHRGYDYILCPSDATRPFFEEAFGYAEEAFVKHGLPSLDRIGALRAGRDAFKNRKGVRAADDGRPCDGDGGRPLTVVYAPTFRDGTWVDAEGLVRAFERAAAEPNAFGEVPPAFELVLKLHPLDAARPEIVADTETLLIEWYAKADIVITDYSGVAVEAAAAGVASYYYVYDINNYKMRRGLNVDLHDEAVGKYAFIDADELVAQMMQDFADVAAPAYDYEALEAFASKYLEVPLEGNTQRLAAFIARLHHPHGQPQYVVE
ncbi:MAG: CDP-glycerol glycerophosphotransferase family protein [Clostridiales bacterium]|nr:CDP-glycerol glycerophosphotransferase family protein [Clostridiales bacterium]